MAKKRTCDRCGAYIFGDTPFYRHSLFTSHGYCQSCNEEIITTLLHKPDPISLVIHVSEYNIREWKKIWPKCHKTNNIKGGH